MATFFVKLTGRPVFKALSIGLAVCLAAATGASAAAKAVTLPSLAGDALAPRVVYLENPRFPRLSTNELATVVDTALALVREHFGVALQASRHIAVLDIDPAFAAMSSGVSERFKASIGDFRNDKVDWNRVRGLIIKQIRKQEGSLPDQIAFARPYLSEPLTSTSMFAFAKSVVKTYRARLSHWTRAVLSDGYPMIGRVPGREDLPLNEYVYWAMLAKRGIDAEIILTNQLVASVEYLPTPVHTAIRGGITGGSTEYNPKSRLGASVWVSLAPFLLRDEQVRSLRNGRDYAKAEALQLAGVLLAHELGHLLLHLDHPWSNEACLMRPAEVLDFAAWKEKLDARKCPLGSESTMSPGTLRIPVW